LNNSNNIPTLNNSLKDYQINIEMEMETAKNYTILSFNLFSSRIIYFLNQT